jgi:two-component system, NarL family, nitrate/nitrite response regulator NarL
MRIQDALLNRNELDSDQRQKRHPFCMALISGHPICQESYAKALRSIEDAVLVEGACANDAIAFARDGRADIIIIDVENLPGGSADLPQRLARDYPKVRVVVLSDSDRPDNVAAAFEGGVRGYILKSVDSSELVRIVKTIRAGETYVIPQLAARAIIYQRDAHGARKLTEREEEVLAYVARGLSNKEIAKTLRLSDKTVKHYMTTIMDKLHVRNRLEAAMAMHRRPGA